MSWPSSNLQLSFSILWKAVAEAVRTRDANVGLQDLWHLVTTCAPFLAKEIPFPAGKKGRDPAAHRGRGAGCRIQLWRYCGAELTTRDNHQMMGLL